MTRKEQTEMQRLNIMKHALSLFIKKGRRGTAIQDIAASAKISVGLLYNYFESKDKLYEELVKVGVSGPNGMMSLEAVSPLSFFETAAKSIMTMLEDEYASQMFIFMSQALIDDNLPDSIKQLLGSQNNIAASIDIIKRGQELGEIRDGEPISLSCAFWCALQGIAEQKARTSELPLPDYKWIVDIIRR